MSSDFPAGWDEAPLVELVRVHHGFAFKGEYFRDRGPGDILVTPGNFAIGGGYADAKLKYYEGPVEDRFVLQAGDLLVTMTDLSKTSDTLGSPALVPLPPPDGARFLHNQRIGRVEIIAPERVRADYLYAAMRTENYRRQIVASATGTTVRHTSPQRLGEAVIPLPPLDAQERIGHLLNVLDGKITSDRRLMALTERAAMEQFTARIVEFTGAEDRVDSEIGPIPRGWTILPFSEAIEINPRVRLPKGEAVPFVEMAAVAPWGTRPRYTTRREVSSGSKLGPGDTLMARITGCIEHGKGAFVDFVDTPSAGSTEFLVLRARPPFTPEIVFCFSRWSKLRNHAMASMSGTSGRQRVQIACFDDLRIAVPPDAASIAPISTFLAAAMRRSHALWRSSLTTAAIRDALLPRLVSGKVQVPATDANEPGEPPAERAA